MGGVTPKPKTIEAEEFVLRDEKGTRRGLLATTSGQTGSGPSLTLFNPNGDEQVSIVASDRGSFLAIHDAEGELRAHIEAHDRDTSLLLYDENGVKRIELMAEPRYTWLIMREVSMVCAVD
jgi:hypothetical protein